MSVSPSELLTYVNDALNVNETDITLKLRTVVKDISSRGIFLEKVATLTATASTAYIAFPSDMKEGAIPIITVDGGPPLTYITPEEYYNKLDADDSEDEPEYYTKLAGKFYFYPTWSTAAAALTVVIAYAYVHDDAVTTISFGERFRKALQEGLCAEVAESKQRYEASMWHRGQLPNPRSGSYEAEILALLQEVPSRSGYVRYRGLEQGDE